MSHPSHVVIGRHPTYGYVAMNMQGLFMTDHVLKSVQFHPVPGSRFYALTDPIRDGDRRAAQAIASLRAAGYRVDADLSLDPHPPPRDPRLAYMQNPTQTQRATTTVTIHPPVPERREALGSQQTTTAAGAAVAHSPHDTQVHLTPIKGGAPAPSALQQQSAPPHPPPPPRPSNPPARASAAKARSPRWRLWGSGHAQQSNGATPSTPMSPPQLGPRPQARR
ncbi:hypothetical protein ACFY0R_10120 [Streptomyces sp. NPDC001633]|uniref:hypothetical protein n=1 Tax=Streptomyces sp. NPDC001633 TaxID=3364595 RepID=UPI00369E7288